MKKCLIEVTYNDAETNPYSISYQITTQIAHAFAIQDVKVYKNKEKLCVNEASRQCLNCPAYFTQES